MLDVAFELRRGMEAAFSVPETGVTALVGPSGADKSRILGAIAGLIRPVRGRIAIGDHVLFDSETRIDLAPEARRIGFIFREPHLFPHMTVAENLRYGLRRVSRTPPVTRFDDVVASLGLEGRLAQRPAILSGAEKQRVAIGRAILSQPRLLLMNDPLAALDAPRRRELVDYLGRLKHRLNLPIIHVAQDGEEMAALADHLVLIDQSKVIAAGAIMDIFARSDLALRIMGEGWGALIEGKIAGHDLTAGLSEIAFPGGRLKLPLIEGRLGLKLRIRIAAHDIILALAPVEGLSVENALQVKIVDIIEAGNGQADIALAAGPTRLYAQATQAAILRLGLAPGRDIYALIKLAAADRIA